MNILPDQQDPLGTRSLSMALRREIEKHILSGDLSAGHRLNENVYAEKFKVSRGPVREAFRALVEAGLLEFIPHRGVFIRQISLPEAIETYEVRAGLFGLAGRLAAVRIEPKELDALAALVTRMATRLKEGATAEYYEDNLDLHSRIVLAARNDRLSKTYHSLVKELHLFRTINLQSESHLMSSQTEHEEMLEALNSHDELRAYHAHYDHVMRAKARVLEMKEALTPDDAVRQR